MWSLFKVLSSVGLPKGAVSGVQLEGSYGA